MKSESGKLSDLLSKVRKEGVCECPARSFGEEFARIAQMLIQHPL
jgi:hypothetical protein